MGEQEISRVAINNSNEILEQQLDVRNKELEEKLDSDVLFYSGPIVPPSDDLIKDSIEERQNKRNKLTIVLETPGGYIETAKRIAETTRHHYTGSVDFIIPNFAMSAGTILVMSGDSIYMNYYSVLGPIDPQIQRKGGSGLVPALGYLVQYNRFIKKAQKGKLTTPEMTFLIEKFDPAELYRYEQERELSIALLKEWLVKYKFKNWTNTETRRLNVTPKMKETRAKEIVEKLNDTDRWHSHSCGISIEVLRRDLNLKIEDFEANTDLNHKIRNYYRLLVDYMLRRRHDISLHTKGLYFGVATKQ